MTVANNRQFVAALSDNCAEFSACHIDICADNDDRFFNNIVVRGQSLRTECKKLILGGNNGSIVVNSVVLFGEIERSNIGIGFVDVQSLITCLAVDEGRAGDRNGSIGGVGVGGAARSIHITVHINITNCDTGLLGKVVEGTILNNNGADLRAVILVHLQSSVSGEGTVGKSCRTALYPNGVNAFFIAFERTIGKGCGSSRLDFVSKGYVFAGKSCATHLEICKLPCAFIVRNRVINYLNVLQCHRSCLISKRSNSRTCCGNGITVAVDYDRRSGRDIVLTMMSLGGPLNVTIELNGKRHIRFCGSHCSEKICTCFKLNVCAKGGTLIVLIIKAIRLSSHLSCKYLYAEVDGRSRSASLSVCYVTDRLGHINHNCHVEFGIARKHIALLCIAVSDDTRICLYCFNGSCTVCIRIVFTVNSFNNTHLDVVRELKGIACHVCSLGLGQHANSKLILESERAKVGELQIHNFRVTGLPKVVGKERVGSFNSFPRVAVPVIEFDIKITRLDNIVRTRYRVCEPRVCRPEQHGEAEEQRQDA